jgi:hypothetical protein
MKVHANRLGMIPSTEIAFALRVAAERKRLAEAERRRRAKRAEERALWRREIWGRARASLAGPRRALWGRVHASLAGPSRARIA